MTRPTPLEQSAFATYSLAVVGIALLMDPVPDTGRFAPKLALIQTTGIAGAVLLLTARARLVQIARTPALSALVRLLAVACISFLISADRLSFLSAPAALLSLADLASGAVVATLAALAALYAWQRQRLTAVILVTSFAMALMALGQRFRFLGEGSIVNSNDVGSFAGGTIYMAGFLAITIPLAIWNLYRANTADEKPTRSRWLAALVLLVMLSAFFAPEKRGPTVALLSAILVGLYLTALCTGRVDWLKRGLFAAVAVGSALLGLALLQQSVVDLRQIPGIGKLAMIVPLGPGTGDQSRMLIWEKLPELMTTPLILPSGEKDPFAAARLWIGYGPDSVESIVPSKVAFMDHSPGTVTHPSTHNYLWDILVCYGLLGCAAYLAFIFYLYRAGLLYLGLATLSVSAAAACAVAGTILGAALASFIYSPGMLTVGAQAGFLAGVLLPALGSRPKLHANQDTLGAGLMIALLAGLTAHLVDMAFIFPVPATSILFWVMAGMLLGPSLRPSHGEQCEIHPEQQHDPAWPTQAGILIGLALFFMAFAFIEPPTANTMWPVELAEAAKLMVLLFLPVWLVGTQLLCGDSDAAGLRRARWISLGLATGLALANWAWLATVNWTASADLVRFADARGIALPLVFLGGIAAMIWVGRSAVQQPAQSTAKARQAILVAGMTAVVLFAVWTGPARYYRSEVAQGLAERGAGNELAAYALSLRPENWKLRLQHGASRSDETRERLVYEGLKISEFNLLNAHLGQQLLEQAAASRDAQAQRKLASRAHEHLLRAVRYLHQDEESWFNASIAAGEFLGNSAQAEDYVTKANEAVELHVNQQRPPDLHRWGRLYTDKAVGSAASGLSAHYARRAIHYLDRALAAGNDFWSLLARGHAFRILGDNEQARRDYLEAARVGGASPPVDAAAFVSLLGDASATP